MNDDELITRWRDIIGDRHNPAPSEIEGTAEAPEGGRRVAELPPEPAKATLTARQPRAAFRPERVTLPENSADWIVNDIRIGDHDPSAPAPSLDHFVTYETMQVAMDDVAVCGKGEVDMRRSKLGAVAEVRDPPRVRAAFTWDPFGDEAG